MSAGLHAYSLQALAVHTEKIHDDSVWARLQRLIGLMKRRGHRATFFVYPFRAIVAGREQVAFERVKRLAQEGFEIGQHTHFYKGNAIDKPNKVSDLSGENVRLCLQRDYQWLCRIAPLRGFTSGGWAVPEALYPTLVRMGFRYDCSARVPALKQREQPGVLWLERPQIRSWEECDLLLLPTTHTLKSRMFTRRWTDSLHPSHIVRYRLVYFHDYDLLQWQVYVVALWACGFMGRWTTCGEVADAIMNSGGCLDEP